MSQAFQQVFDHFPKKVSKELADYVDNVALLHSRYIFTKRVAGLQQGYCTHCKKGFLTKTTLKHNESVACPNCESLCWVKASGRGRGRLVDEAYVVWYEKSIINPKAIVARGIHVIRDYRDDYKNVQTLHRLVAVYVFEPDGPCINLVNDYGTWKTRSSIVSEFNNSMKNKSCYVAVESIVAAVKHTPFQYSMWSHYVKSFDDMVHFFDLAAKYPCIEYLTKMGLREIVEAKLYGYRTYNAVNWRGKSIEKVLRLTKQEIKEMRNAPVVMDARILKSYQYFKKNQLKITFYEAYLLADVIDSYYFEFRQLFKYASFEKLTKYFLKQLYRDDVIKHYSTGRSVLIALRDYISDCKELGMDLTKEHVLFPNNLYSAHQKTIRKVKIKKDISLNGKILKRLDSLNKFCFEHSGLLIRPAASSIELFDEGKALNHCVGRYAETYAQGNTDLFVIRREEEPEKPFYTVEIIKGKIIQIRGKNNCNATDEVEAFMKAFESEKLTKKPKQRKIKIEERQGVAV
jgi:hypothetical protein